MRGKKDGWDGKHWKEERLSIKWMVKEFLMTKLGSRSREMTHSIPFCQIYDKMNLSGGFH